MPLEEGLYFSDGSVELPVLDLGDQAERIPDTHPDLGESEMAIRVAYQPLGRRIDGRNLEGLEEAVDDLEDDGVATYTAWDRNSFDDGNIRYLESLKACVKNYPEKFETRDILLEPELENRNKLVDNMEAVVEAVDETGLDSGYNTFKGFSAGGFDTAFLDGGEELRLQNPRFVAKIQSPAGMITAGYLPSMAYEGSGLEFGVRAQPDPVEDRVAGRMMGLGLDPEERDCVNIGNDARKLIESLEEKEFDLVETDIPTYRDDPLME